jgi:hypothetical protein
MKERIVIYTRVDDAPRRNMIEAEHVARLFSASKYNVSVISGLPSSFSGQVELFFQRQSFHRP